MTRSQTATRVVVDEFLMKKRTGAVIDAEGQRSGVGSIHGDHVTFASRHPQSAGALRHSDGILRWHRTVPRERLSNPTGRTRRNRQTRPVRPVSPWGPRWRVREQADKSRPEESLDSTSVVPQAFLRAGLIEGFSLGLVDQRAVELISAWIRELPRHRPPEN